MTTTNRLSYLYQQLVARAATTGLDQAAQLAGGARVAVRVKNGEQVVTFSRADVPVGETELAIFCRHCEIPTHAKRQPSTDQGVHNDASGRLRYYVAYRWQLGGAAEQAEQQAMTLTIPPRERAGAELWPDE